jgi:multidrug resistance efflux pump
LVAYHGRANERRQEDHRKAKGRLTFKQRTSVGLACVAVLAASAYGYYWWTVDRFFQSTDDAYVGGNVTPISPHISGFIAAILVGDNQRVKAGQLVVRLDDRDVRAAADHAEAILKARKATLESLRAKYELQQSTIQQAFMTLLDELQCVAGSSGNLQKRPVIPLEEDEKLCPSFQHSSQQHRQREAGERDQPGDLRSAAFALACSASTLWIC